MNFTSEYSRIKREFETFLQEKFALGAVPEKLAEPMRYSVMSGGKRLRPVLFLATVKAFGAELTEAAYEFAAGIECLHTYTLVHDDLPCMDNDDFRRGKETTHKKYGETLGVLSGDALQTYAFELIFSAIEKSGYTAGAVKAGALFARLVGGEGTIGGQTEDLFFDGKDEDTLLRIYKNKTCNLIISAVACSALFAGAAEDKLQQMSEYGYNLGMAFQIADDILDEKKNEECSVLRFYSVTDARKMLNEYTAKAKNCVARKIAFDEFFIELAETFANRGE